MKRNCQTIAAIMGLLMFTSRAAVASFGDPADTTKTYHLPEVVVMADRLSLTQKVEPSRVYQISKLDLESSNGRTLGEVLLAVPGTLVETYGPGGGLQTVSIRGMDAEHTLILLDGVPFNNAQNGQNDLRLFPLTEIEGVEIERGGASAAFGANPLGGAVNIQTSRPTGGSGFQTTAVAGSFGESEFDARVNLNPSGVIPFSVGISEQTGRENYPFDAEQNGPGVHAERINSDYRSKNIFVTGNWLPDPSARSVLFVTYGEMERGTPGPFQTVQNQGLARQEDRQLEAIGSMQFTGENALRGAISGSIQTSYEHYTNKAEPFVADNYYQDALINFLPSMEYQVSPAIRFTAGGEFGSALAAGNAIAAAQHRDNVGIYFVPSVVLEDVLPDWKIGVYPSVRFDAYGGWAHVWSPRMGLNVDVPVFGMRAVLHTVAGSSFRVPTFNELYYDGAGGTGNPTLQPEHSFSAEGGMTLKAGWVGAAECDITYYSIRTSDKIFWLPTAILSVYSPRNIGEAISSGWECEVRWKFWNDRVEVGGTYSWLDAHENNSASSSAASNAVQLPYVPLDMGGAKLNVHIPLKNQYVTGVFGNITDGYVGIRYLTEEHTLMLPSYHLINTTVGIEFRFLDLHLRAKYDVNNLFNRTYEVVSGYPMPLQNQSIRCDLFKQF